MSFGCLVAPPKLRPLISIVIRLGKKEVIPGLAIAYYAYCILSYCIVSYSFYWMVYIVRCVLQMYVSVGDGVARAGGWRLVGCLDA